MIPQTFVSFSLSSMTGQSGKLMRVTVVSTTMAQCFGLIA